MSPSKTNKTLQTAQHPPKEEPKDHLKKNTQEDPKKLKKTQKKHPKNQEDPQKKSHKKKEEDPQKTTKTQEDPLKKKTLSTSPTSIISLVWLASLPSRGVRASSRWKRLKELKNQNENW